ncbi:hypothetical protein BDR05DRAFT_945547 [Suillus weaverae]|nr:hypothetical protein BDR05DRAFT_945547 [Suillus weaverae]
MVPKASQEVSTRRTRPVNANTHPGRPVIEAKAEERLQNSKRKPRTKSSKVTDDPHANESPEEKSARIQKAAEQIAGIEDTMEALEAQVQGGIKAKPVRPHPVGKGKKTSSQDITDDKTTCVDPEDTLLSDGETEVVGGKKKKEKAAKMLLKEAIKNAHKTDNIDSDAHAISDKKGNNAPFTTKKLSLGGLISNWANDVPAEPKSTTPSSRSNTYSASHTATTPPSSVLSTSTKTSSKAKPAHTNQKQSTITPESNDVLMVSDNSLDDCEVLEQRPAVLPRKKGKQAIKKSTTLIVPASESDSEPKQIMFSAQPGSIKHKVDDVRDFVDETASEATDDSSFLADDSQDSLLPKVTSIPAIEKGRVSHKTTSTSTIVSQSATLPPSKKLKKESSERGVFSHFTHTHRLPPVLGVLRGSLPYGAGSVQLLHTKYAHTHKRDDKLEMLKLTVEDSELK